MSRALTFVGSRATVVALVAAGGALTVAGALPAGAASAYSVTRVTDPATGAHTVVRWAPCTVTSTGAIATHYITYRINTAGVPSRVRLPRDPPPQGTAARRPPLPFPRRDPPHPPQPGPPPPTRQPGGLPPPPER